MDPITAAVLGYGALAGVGAGTNWFGLGGDKEEATAQYFDPYAEQRQQLMNVLYQGTQTGVPGLEQYGQNLFSQLTPQIQEVYQAKRGLGAGSTPEVAALGRSAQDVTNYVTGLQAQARQNYASTLAGLLGQPTTAITQGGTGLAQNLLSFASPILSSYLSSQAYGPLLDKLFPNQGAIEEIKPTFSAVSSPVGLYV